MKKFFLLPVVLVSFNLYSQNISEFNIKTFFHCNNGKALIEKELLKVDGILSVNADVNTKIVSVKYDKSKCDTLKIISEIERIGYYTQYSDRQKQIKKACSHDNEEHNEKNK